MGPGVGEILGARQADELMSMAANASQEWNFEPSYFTYEPYTAWLIAHIALMVLAWVFILPITVMLSIARSKLSLLGHLVFVFVNTVGLFIGTFYNSKTPDLYPGNAHHKFGWFLTWFVIAYAFLSVIGSYSASEKRQTSIHDIQYKHFEDHHDTAAYRYSRDSGQGTELSSPRTSIASSPYSFSNERQTEHFDKHETGDEEVAEERRGLLGNNAMDRFFSRKLVLGATSRLLWGVRLFCSILDRLVLILGFVALATGVVTYGGHFKGHGIFSGLAHFVKGGIFFWYGLLVLGRMMGSFADFGWSWNLKPNASVVGRRKANAPTAEFAESFLLFLYGSINVFLEHLGSENGEWSATDLEHVSISVMFLGGGLCGMLIESSRLRDLLSSALLNDSAPQSLNKHLETWQPPKTAGFSLNPMPAIILMLLGKMMSGHHQASMVSTMLHAQWGGLFTVAALARGVTYLLVYLSPPTSYLPSRPPSELVAAFCLISGGLLFMSSNSDFVTGMEMYDLNAMFLFTVVMGFTAFLMAWEITVLAIKGWAVKQQAA